MSPVPDEVEALIADADASAHLATSVNDRPHVAPVWYNYRDGTIEAVTDGKKIENLERNPRVAVSIEEFEDGEAAWEVTLLGTATLSEDEEAVRDGAYRVFSRYLGEDVEEWDEFYQQRYEEPTQTLVTIEVSSVAGMY